LEVAYDGEPGEEATEADEDIDKLLVEEDLE
jgi:hypothetical protein